MFRLYGGLFSGVSGYDLIVIKREPIPGGLRLKRADYTGFPIDESAVTVECDYVVGVDGVTLFLFSVVAPLR